MTNIEALADAIFRWITEAQERYKDNNDMRPSSAPLSNPRILSLMDIQEPVFHLTKAYRDRGEQMPVGTHIQYNNLHHPFLGALSPWRKCCLQGEGHGPLPDHQQVHSPPIQQGYAADWSILVKVQYYVI